MSFPIGGGESTPLLTRTPTHEEHHNENSHNNTTIYDNAIFHSTANDSNSDEHFKSASNNVSYKTASLKTFKSLISTPYVSTAITPYHSVATPYESVKDVDNSDEYRRPINTTDVDSEIKVYKKRWYILIVFASLAFMQSELCNSWTVIAESVHAAFGWSMEEISLMQLWLFGMYIICIYPFTWLMENKGMRKSMVVTAILLFSCSLLRCVSVTPPAASWLNNIGQCVLGIAGVVLFVSGPVISSIWFPPEQRSTATAIGTVAGFIGAAFCFLYGPLLVNEPITITSPNGTTHFDNVMLIRHQIRTIRIIECGVCGVLLVLTIVYFPSKPPKPPSRSAALPKLNFMVGLKGLFRKESYNFWLICLAFSISTGIYGIYSGLFAVNFMNILSQKEIGLLGALSITFGCVSAVMIGRLSDVFARRMKLMTVILMSGSVLSTFWVLLLAKGYVPLSEGQIYVAVVLQGFCINAPIPLFYELAVESNYPIDEIVTSGMMSLLYNIFPALFLGIFFIPNVGTSWMNWCMYASILACMPFILCFKERYRRFNIDVRDKDTED